MASRVIWLPSSALCLLLCLANPTQAKDSPKVQVQVKRPDGKVLQKHVQVQKQRAYSQQAKVKVIKEDIKELQYKLAKDRLRLYNQAAKKYRWKLNRYPRKSRHQRYWKEWVYLTCLVDQLEFERKGWLHRKVLKFRGKTPKTVDYYIHKADARKKKDATRRANRRRRRMHRARNTPPSRPQG